MKELTTAGELAGAESTSPRLPSESLNAVSSAVSQAEAIASRRKDAHSLGGVCSGSDNTFSMMSHHPGAQMTSVVGQRPNDLYYSPDEALHPVDFTKCLRAIPVSEIDSKLIH